MKRRVEEGGINIRINVATKREGAYKGLNEEKNRSLHRLFFKRRRAQTYLPSLAALPATASCATRSHAADR